MLALSGGIGGAKLALGLARVLPPGALTVVANTGDDFEHLGLHISPDLDTVTYALAGVDNPETGWGRRDETWSFMAGACRSRRRDLVQAWRPRSRVACGADAAAAHRRKLSAITADVARRLGIASRILPMTDDRVRTMVRDARWACSNSSAISSSASALPQVTGFVFEGAETASAASGHSGDTAQIPHLRAVVICPSNPYISIDPILALPGMRAALKTAHAPVIAVSPIIAGRAVKGPTAKMMAELGLAADVRTVAAHYGNILDGYVIDAADAQLADEFDVPVSVTTTLDAKP